ncbi:phosphate:Na+ symporter [Alkalispirochaeta americana]|uniref:Phosphate:Na+ symporter n=2 Tax=Alkalispirochaeta americana TaxID=159291 RepID=A0A1N6U681_9SPIO|nr:phosphate:Na+ symporter [Alkalispirochaeta americana]
MVDSGATSFERTPWVLAGINLGATALCWLIALGGYRISLAPAALLLLIVALPLRQHGGVGRYACSEILGGLSLLMLGLEFVSGRSAVIPGAPPIPGIFSELATSPSAFAIVFTAGLVVSAGFHSSTGAVVLAMSFAARGWISPELAAVATLGANVGAPVIFQLSVRELGKEARKTALFYLMAGIISTIAGCVGRYPLLWLSHFLLPDQGGPSVAAQTAFFYSSAHLIALPVIGLLKAPLLLLIGKIYPSEEKTGRPLLRPALLRSRIPETLDADLTLIQSSLAGMAHGTYEMMMILMNVSQIGDDIDESGERVLTLRENNRDLMNLITRSLTARSQLPCNTAQAERMWQQQRIAQELGLIGEDCLKTMRLFIGSHTKKLRFHQESQEELFQFSVQVMDFLRYISDYLEGRIERPEPAIAGRMEDGIDRLRDKLEKRARTVLERHDGADVRGELAFIDIIAHLEHVGDRCLTISETVRQLSETRGRPAPSES